MKYLDLLSFLTATLVTASLAFGANLMPNGNFEAAPAAGHIPGWSTVPASALGLGHQGKQGLLLSQEDSSRVAAYISDPIAVPAGTKTLYASAYVTNVKNIGGDGSLVLAVLFFDTKDKPLGEAIIERTKETPNVWRKVRTVITLPDGVHHVKISFKLDKAKGAGGLDDVVLDTEDFGQVSTEFRDDHYVFSVGETVSFKLTATRATTVQIRDYDDKTVREIKVEAGKPTPVTLEKLDPGIYWITDPGGAFINSFAVVIPAPKLADPEKGHFGVHYAYMDRDPAFVARTLDVFQKIGAAWLRCNAFLTGDPEHESLPGREAFLRETQKRGLHVLPVFQDYNFPASAQPCWTNPVAVRMIARHVTNFRNKLRYFEVWNEANFTDGDYFTFHKACYKAIKQANPAAQVVQNGIASPSYLGEWSTKYTGPQFQEILLKLGIDQYTDVYNFHFYPWQWRTEDIVGQYMAVLRKYGVKKPVWVTENGNVMDLINFPQQKVGAEYLVKSAVTCLALGVDKYFWFIAFDHPDFNWGLIADDGRRPKAAVVAYATLARLLGDTECIDRPSGGISSPQAFRFRSGAREVLVLWNENANAQIDLAMLKLTPGPITAVDMMGRSKSIARDAKITVMTSPQFLVIEKAGSN